MSKRSIRLQKAPFATTLEVPADFVTVPIHKNAPNFCIKIQPQIIDPTVGAKTHFKYKLSSLPMTTIKTIALSRHWGLSELWSFIKEMELSHSDKVYRIF